MIKIRTNILGTNEYIEVEKQLQPDRVLKQDESLEKAVFRIENVELQGYYAGCKWNYDINSIYQVTTENSV